MSARSFTGIGEHYVTRVYGFFGYLLSSRDEAEDLTQLTFERAPRAWERYDKSRGEESTWLLAIARNLFADHMRAAGAARLKTVDDADLEAKEPAPDRHSIGLEPDLERALAELSPGERELIALRFGADMTRSEIACLTGLGFANVQQILSRSLRRMQASLDGGSAAAARASVG